MLSSVNCIVDINLETLSISYMPILLGFRDFTFNPNNSVLENEAEFESFNVRILSH